MLHQELMFRFEEPAVNLPVQATSQVEEDSNCGGPDMSGLHLIISVCGNVIVGSALIGGLFLAPHWLAPVLGLF